VDELFDVRTGTSGSLRDQPSELAESRKEVDVITPRFLLLLLYGCARLPSPGVCVMQINAPSTANVVAKATIHSPLVLPEGKTIYADQASTELRVATREREPRRPCRLTSAAVGVGKWAR
jgi:hypothetical protein